MRFRILVTVGCVIAAICCAQADTKQSSFTGDSVFSASTSESDSLSSSDTATYGISAATNSVVLKEGEKADWGIPVPMIVAAVVLVLAAVGGSFVLLRVLDSVIATYLWRTSQPPSAPGAAGFARTQVLRPE